MRRNLLLGEFIVILSTAGIISFLLFYDFGKAGSRVIDTTINFGHLPLFGVVALVVLRILGRGKRAGSRKSTYLLAWAITSFLGAFTECVQAILPYRHFRIFDILTDSLGAALFLTVTCSFHTGTEKRGITLLRNGLLILMIIRAYPILSAAIDTWNMENNFPVLSSFETPLETSRWICREGSMKRTSLHATSGAYSLEVNLPQGMYPGITLDSFVNDWRGYNQLSFDVFMDGTTPLRLSTRINDRTHNEEYGDRYNRTFLLRPGNNRVSIKLDEVRTAPKGRLMDMSDITVLCLFSYQLKEPRKAYFDNFRLVNRG